MPLPRRERLAPGLRPTAESLARTTSAIPRRYSHDRPRLHGPLDEHEIRVMPGLKKGTHDDYVKGLRQLRKAFEGAPVEAITTQVLAQYRDGRKAKVRANRELALLSTIFTHAREWGFTTQANPCLGLRRNKEVPRDFYAGEAVWDAVYAVAPQELKDARALERRDDEEGVPPRWRDRQPDQMTPSCGTAAFNCGTLQFLQAKKKPRKLLIYGALNSGGRGRNRTGVDGFAIHCITILLLGLRVESSALASLTCRNSLILQRSLRCRPC